MSGHVHNKRQKLLLLATTGAFVFASTATAMAATSGGSNPVMAASATALVSQNATWQQSLADQAFAKQAAASAAQLAAAKKAAAAKAAAAKKAAAAAAAKKAAAAAAKRKAAAEAAAAKKQQAAQLASSDPRQIALGMLSQFGWSSSQFSCLDNLWTRESNWEVSAENPSSGAYGIPQALPASKMASAGPDWQTNAATQIRWGLGYIRDVYGSPCGAWGHETSYGWY